MTSSAHGRNGPASAAATLLPKPEEPSIDVFIGDVKERRPSGGLARPVGGGPAAIRPLGFPQANPNKHYGMSAAPELAPLASIPRASSSSTSLQPEGNVKSTKTVSFEIPAAVTIPKPMLSSLASGGVSSSGSSYASAAQADNAVAILLATLHCSSFRGDIHYPLTGALLHALEQQPSPGATPSSNVPADVSGDDFVQLIEKALVSPIPHHRIMAMDVILREIHHLPPEGDDSSISSSSMDDNNFRHYFLFGPHCGRRVHRLVFCLSQAAPREVVRVLEVLSCLVGELMTTSLLHSEALSDFAVPLGDASIHAADGTTEQPVFEPFPSEDTLRQLSEDLRLDVAKGLYLLGLHLVLPRVALAPSDWTVVAGVPATEARRIFWPLLSMMCSFPPTVVALFGSGGAEASRGGAFLELVKGEVSSSLRPFLLGHAPHTGGGCDDILDESQLGDAVLLSVLHFLRKVCHVRQGCFALVDTVRPLLSLLLEHFKEDVGNSSQPIDALHPPAGEKSSGGMGVGVMVSVGSLLVLRSLIRHGCDQALADFVPHIVALVSIGSLGVAELALLSSVGAEDGDQNVLPPSIASNLAQVAYRIIAGGAHGSDGHRARKQDVLLHTLAQSTAYQYLATYVGMEGLRAFAPWLAPTVPEAQEALKVLLATKLMTSQELEWLFPSAQTAQFLVKRNHHNNAAATTRDNIVASSVEVSLRMGRSYNLVRFITSIPRVFPATRRVVLGYCDTILARFLDLMMDRRYAAGSQGGGSGGSDIASQCKSVGGIMFGSPLSVEELSTALEVVSAQTASLANDDDDNPTTASADLKRNTKAVAVLLLDVMSKTMQCLDSAPLLAAMLFPDDALSADAVVTAVSARSGNDATVATMDPATISAGWMSKLFWLHVPAGAHVLITALTCHPRARHVFPWELLLSDVLLWSCGHRPSSKDEEVRRCDVILVLAQIALTEGKMLNPAVNQSIASTVGPYITAAYAVVSPRLPPSVVGALCVGAVLLQPEASLACLRALQDTRDDFSATLDYFTSDDATATGGKNATVSANNNKPDAMSVLAYMDILFHQSLYHHGTLERLHQVSRTTATTASSTSVLLDDDDQALHPLTGDDISAWSSLQRIVECLQLTVPLFRATCFGSWPHLACGFMIRRLSLRTSASLAGASAQRLSSSDGHDFVTMCIEDTLHAQLHWSSFEEEDAKAEEAQQQLRQWQLNGGSVTTTTTGNAAAAGRGRDVGGDVWDDDEFAF